MVDRPINSQRQVFTQEYRMLRRKLAREKKKKMEWAKRKLLRKKFIFFFIYFFRFSSLTKARVDECDGQALVDAPVQKKKRKYKWNAALYVSSTCQCIEKLLSVWYDKRNHSDNQKRIWVGQLNFEDEKSPNKMITVISNIIEKNYKYNVILLYFLEIKYIHILAN